MCFYEQTIFSCEDYKWGRFRAHCAKEYRTGETCGMRLIYEASRVPQKCNTCKRVEVIQRKIAASQDRIYRWNREGINPVSADVELTNIAAWKRELAEIELLRSTKARHFR